MRSAMRPRLLAVLALLPLALLAGCASPHRPVAVRDQPPTEPIFSPAGEPLNGGPLGYPTCMQAVANWFARTDARHDGAIDRDAFLADAKRQFAVMDLNHDGRITPDELNTYRTPFHAFPSMSQDPSGPPEDSSQQGGHRQIGGRTKVSVAGDQADPVMSADVGLKFRVTLADFLAYEQNQFDLLDRARRGRVTLAQTQQVLCPAEAQE